MQRGATKVGLGLDDIRNVLVPMPPLQEQHEIVRRVEALFKIADDIEKRYQKAKAHVDKLTQSILAKAFRGELVPQDPNDEPASELLKRIQAERKNQEAEARPGRKLSKRRVKN
jgi:type I restriction enzyme S subunit